MDTEKRSNYSQFNEQDLLFRPKPRPDLHRIADYTTDIEFEIRKATYIMEDTFLGRRDNFCKQSEWMGRGCFIPISSSRNQSYNYLTAKGVGSGPGSELIRQLLDNFLRNRHDGYGGCLRLETDTFYPLLIQFWDNHRSWIINDPRPEGFSSFTLLLRDAQSSLLLNQLGIRVLIPLLLLRHRLTSPWGEETRTSLQRYLLTHLPQAISQHLQSRGDSRIVDKTIPISPHIHKISYSNLDGGILIRATRSPYRVANLLITVIKKNAYLLNFLAHHLLLLFNFKTLSKDTLWNVSLKFTSVLAQTAAKLFCEGIVHGQLNQHYQNITLAAELADFDCTVFVRSMDRCAKAIPFSSSISLDVYKTFLDHIKHTSSQLSIDPLAIMYADYEALTGISKRNFNEAKLASSMLGQVYDLYNHSLRVADILSRVLPLNLEQPGTVLSNDAQTTIQFCFKRIFKNYLSQKRSELLLSWVLKRGYNYFIDTLTEYQGKYSIYGWAASGLPVDDSCVACDQMRLSHTLQEVESLFQGL